VDPAVDERETEMRIPFLANMAWLTARQFKIRCNQIFFAQSGHGAFYCDQAKCHPGSCSGSRQVGQTSCTDASCPKCKGGEPYH
jgi:hypothetical protein